MREIINRSVFRHFLRNLISVSMIVVLLFGSTPRNAYAAQAVESSKISLSTQDTSFENNAPVADHILREGTNPPVAVDDVYATEEDTQLSISLPGVLQNDSDLDGDPLTAVVNTDPLHGTLTLQSDGSFEYKPDKDFNGPDSFTYHANDGVFNSNIATVAITVNAVNDAPVITGQLALGTNEDTSLTISLDDLIVTDPDNIYPDDFTLTVQGGANYTVAGSTITPALNFNGTLTVPVKVNDGSADSNVFDLSVTVTAVNDPPVITGQTTLSTFEDTALTIALTNLTVIDPDNTYPNGFTLVVQSGTNYSVVGATITPASNFNGNLTVLVKVNDGAADSSVYNLHVTVTAINDPPVITGQSTLSTNKNRSLTIALNNLTVTDPDNTYPTGFSLTVLNGSNYSVAGTTITPALNFSGSLSVLVKVNDGEDDSNVYNLNVTVILTNEVPVITGQKSLSTNEDTALTISLNDLLVTDLDNVYPNDFTLTVQSGTNYTVLGATITPAANYHGTLTVPVKVNDGTADSNVYSLTVIVNAVNDAPVITGQVVLSTNEDTSLTITLANLTVTDVDNTYPSGFTLTVHSGTNYTEAGAVITPAANFHGTLSVPVNVNDGTSNSNTFNLSVTVVSVNDAPVITGQNTLSTNENIPLTITLGALLVTDPDNTYPTGFTLTVLSGSNYTVVGATITPATNFNGNLTIPVKVNDGNVDSNVYNLSVTVYPVNNSPIITGQTLLSTNEDTSLTITLANLTVTDPDNPYPTGFTLTVQPFNNYSVAGTTITPAANFNGTLTVPVSVNDGSADSNVFNLSVTVNAVNDAPVITGQATLTTAEETALTITLTNLTVTDPDNAYPTGFSLSVLTGTNYTVAGATITPVANFNGILTIPVRVNDGSADSNTYNLSVTVTALNDPPVITGQAVLATAEDTALTLTLSNLTVTDPDNTYPTGFTLTVQPGTNYTVVGTTITPALNFSGTLTVPVKVNDGTADSNLYNLNVTVTAINDAPVITGQVALTTAEETALTITLANLTVTDPDNTYPTGFTLNVQSGTNYTVVGATITPALNFNGILAVQVKVNDGTSDSNLYSLNVTVTAVNDAPVITGQVVLTTAEDTALTITLANLTVTDPDNTYPTGFTLTVQAGTNYTVLGAVITPILNFTGNLTVPVKVNDGTADSNVYNLAVAVTAVNDAPVISGQVVLSTNEDTALTIVLANLTVTDPDNTYPTGFSLTVQAGTNYTVAGATITPALNFNGTLTVPVKVNDGTADSNVYSLTVTVTAVNDAPVISGQVVLSTNEDTALTIALANLTVTDPDNTYPTGFTLTVQPGTNYTVAGAIITPAANYNGALTVPVKVNDGKADSNQYNLTITVTAINDAPVCQNILFNVDEESTGQTTPSCTDAENDPITFTIVVQPTHGTASVESGKLQYVSTGYNGADTFTYKANDGKLDSNVATVSVTVRSVYNISTWYLAEGYTGAGFGTYILIQNPNDVAARVRLTYMLQGGGKEVRFVTVAANSRFTVVAQDPAQLGLDKAFSTQVDADQQIIVERAMYWPNGDGSMGGDETVGVQHPSSTWYLAEGYTGAGFQTFILIQNPTNTVAKVDVTYMLQDGTNIVKTVTVPANARYTIAVNDSSQLGPDKAFSTKLNSDQLVIVERAMYFNNDGHVATGNTQPYHTWYLAEGYTGDGFGTYILLQNPNSIEAQVQLTYMLQEGGSIIKNVIVPPNARYTVVAQEAAQVGLGQAFSTKIVSNLPIIVERAMYWPNGNSSVGGTVNTGNVIADKTWYLAEGYTGAGFSTFILIQNPTSTQANITATYMFQEGGTQTQTFSVAPNSRYTIVARDIPQVGLDKAFSTRLASDQPIIVERSMYFNNGGHDSSGVVLNPLSLPNMVFLMSPDYQQGESLVLLNTGN